MNFTARSVPYKETGYFSRIITDYLSGQPFLKEFIQHEVSVKGIESAIREREKFPTDRKLLADVLKHQYAELPVYDAVKTNIDRLLLEHTFTVTTAHQPAIFTGTLYFIYKILHVIRLAESFSVRFPDKHFVPVFYMGSEDADFDELGHIYLDNEKVNWNTKQTGAVGRMSTEGLGSLIQRIEGELSGHAHGPELIQLLKDCYLQAPTIQEATLRLLHQLFGSYGLVVLIPDNRRLKAAMAPVFIDDLTSHTPFEITAGNIRKLSTQYNAQANPREINLFYLKEDLRERLEFQEGRYRVVNTSISFSREEIAVELKEFPERFSPNVILRGLFQETVLPDIAFVGGGGEMAYWLELKPLFTQYKVPYPVLILRNSFLLIRKNWKAKMQHAGLTVSSVFQPEEKLLVDHVRTHSEHQLDLHKELTRIRTLYDEVKSVSGAVDKTLVEHVVKLEAQAIGKLLELEKKMLRAEKRNHESVRQKIHAVKEALFPLNNLQERIENFIPWYAEYGKNLIHLLFEHSQTLEQSFVVLEEND